MIIHVNNMESNDLIYSWSKFKLPHVLRRWINCVNFWHPYPSYPRDSILTAEISKFIVIQ